MNIVALKAELTSDPLARGYAAMTDGAAAISLHTPNRPTARAIPAQDLHAWFVFNGKWPAVVDLSVTPSGGVATDNQILAAKSFVEICHYFAELDMAQTQYASGIQFCLDQFQLRSIISGAQKTAIVALGTGLISRAEELGLGAVSRTDVAEARRV